MVGVITLFFEKSVVFVKYFMPLTSHLAKGRHNVVIISSDEGCCYIMS